MSGMAEVLAAHCYWGYIDGHGQSRCECGEWFAGDAEYLAHLETELVAAGFGPVKDAAQVTEAQWQEVAELADPIVVAQPYTQADLREAAAVALEEAADDIRTSSDCGNHYNPSACETCSAVAVLRDRAAAVRDES